MKKFLTKIKIGRIELSIFLLIPFLYLIRSGFKVSNDSWFLLNHGRYVLENGLPYIEPFTIHKNFNFIMQQWLYSVFFYLIYKKFSFWGLIIFSFILYVITYYAFYKLCLFVSKENRIVATVNGKIKCRKMVK